MIAHLTGFQIARRLKISFPSLFLLIKGHALTPLTASHKPAIIEPFIQLYESLSERIAIGEITPDNEDFQRVRGLMLEGWWFDLEEIHKFEDEYGLTLETDQPSQDQEDKRPNVKKKWDALAKIKRENQELTAREIRNRNDVIKLFNGTPPTEDYIRRKLKKYGLSFS